MSESWEMHTPMPSARSGRFGTNTYCDHLPGRGASSVRRHTRRRFSCSRFRHLVAFLRPGTRVCVVALRRVITLFCGVSLKEASRGACVCEEHLLAHPGWGGNRLGFGNQGPDAPVGLARLAPASAGPPARVQEACQLQGLSPRLGVGARGAPRGTPVSSATPPSGEALTGRCPLEVG